ncbi:Cilia- and flagella-associated protein 57 [Phytophthora citrophthora]|uniref:Cilia- and flagella-associated protein 57 n=1 Tax=Phytophthora citrophthora TaxID=4793 RepID=A0AAD9LDW7_9STRA|nr:Cilia- and flagella-associated protein 57 [Phytophthora citrophthora]
MREGISTGEHPSPLTLVPVSGNGLDLSFRDIILPLSRHELILAIGKYVVLQNIQSQELSFVASGDQTSGVLGEITAMTLCGKRQYLSVCRAAVKNEEENLNSPASISVYKVTSRTDQSIAKGANSRRISLLKTLTVAWTDRFVGTALSPDGKLVSAQAANSTWSLGVWDWGRGRQVALSEVHCRVSRVRFNVIDMAQLSTSGGNLLRIWTLCEYTLKPLASFKSGDETKVKNVVNYADHAWLPDDVLVALLEDGDVQLVVNAELMQTLRAVHKGLGKLVCMSPLSNGEGVVVGGTHGLVSVVRVASKMLKANEKELHLQRRMRVPNTYVSNIWIFGFISQFSCIRERIVSVTTDPAAAMLLCCTERGYGAYDLSNLCLLRGDDEAITLSLLASTPLSQEMEKLTAASRRPCFAASCRLPDGDAAVHVWSQMDCHECFIAHPLEQQTPLSVDIHPSGSEILVTFLSKLQIYFVLQDSLRLGFEMPQKQLSLAQYSPSGALFAAVHATNKTIYLYRGLSRVQREPQLVGIIRNFRDTIEIFRWTVHDNSFFAADATGELCHCALRWQSGGDVEDLVTTHSSTQTLASHNVIMAFTSCYINESHDYAVFVAEKKGNSSRKGSSSQSIVRAWVNGELTVDSLQNNGSIGETLPFQVTALESGPGLGSSDQNLLFTGTENGSVVIFSWKRGPRSIEGNPTIILSHMIRRVDLHTSSVVGLFYASRSRQLLSNSKNGVVLACKLCREISGESSSDLATAIRDEQNLHDLSTHGFSSICQPEELAVYDRNKVELSRLKLLDLDAELQQFKMENEMLSRQVKEQRLKFENTLKGELAAYARSAEEDQKALRFELDARLGGAIHEREKKLRSLSEDARSAQDHYLISMEKLQSECDTLREQLQRSKLDLEDEQKRAEEREMQLEYENKKNLREAKAQFDSRLKRQSEELELTKKKLQEVLRQLDQDHLVQMGLLASTIDCEKQKGALQLAEQNGKAAALNQEVKMLLGALNHKDGELQQMHCDYEEKLREVQVLRDRLADEKAFGKKLLREKDECAAQLADQKRLLDNLQRVDGVHRSQLELLQRHILPKDQELAKMQEHLNQLHDANQEVVVQANISDRLRVETSSLAKKHERELVNARRRLEKVRHSIVVLQEELGELLQRSTVQEKSTLVTEIGRLHKKITRQLDALQARGDSAKEVNAELHRQNRFLLQNKHSLRRQVEAGNREKHKLAAFVVSERVAGDGVEHVPEGQQGAGVEIEETGAEQQKNIESTRSRDGGRRGGRSKTGQRDGSEGVNYQ